VGFCGLDRRRLPLLGDEVRACWEDSATQAPADPVTPGLLDLLTTGMIPETRTAETAPDVPADGRVPRDPARDGRNQRTWVEIEA
jgi:hypothetical protein